ncbi:MAG: dihydrodipicolinate reductase [Streptomycetaceae bacterium]|nr:dihydrodipicolinate reductase [Streptomycetaceae bacterium]
MLWRSEWCDVRATGVTRGPRVVAPLVLPLSVDEISVLIAVRREGLGVSYRVVQWATGNIGTRALRHVIEHPDLELAGVFVHSADKAGRDAGELCGAGPTGVLATGDVDEVLALGADCVLYMPQACDLDVVCRLLESGANIVTTRGEFHHPGSMDPAVRKRVEAAGERGGTSIHSTGSSPGFITEALPLVLSSIQRRLDRIAIAEFADLSSRDSPGLLFDVMGFGKPPEAYDERRLSHGRTSFGPSLRVVADAFGTPLDDVAATGEVAVAEHDIHIAAGTVPAGTVAAQRMTVSGLRDGEPLLSFSATWYCGTDIDASWDLRATGWHVAVDGDAPLDLDIRFPVPVERFASVSPGYTANRAVNAVPYVCAAAPGIRPILELPQIVPVLRRAG